MTEAPKVLLVVTQDTKQLESRFLRECLENGGCEVIHLDPSVRANLGGAEIGPDEIAGAAGTTMADVRAIGHEGKIQEVMIAGATKLALDLHARVGLSGVLSIGGSMGTTFGTAIMRAFPYGVPKLMISTLASGFTAPFVGLKDIAMLNAVCDVSGINSITREVYRNGAFGLAGMARAYAPAAADTRPLVLVSALGTTEGAARGVREGLEAIGYEVMVFHTTGNGGMTMDALAAERDVAAVVDISLVEVNDFLNGGICSAGPERATAGLKRGIPTVMAPGNVDFYIMPSPMAVGERPFEGRRFHIHNAALTAVRTTEDDLKRLADHLAGILREARGPVRFLIPLDGFSSHDSPAGHIHAPELPPKFAGYCRKVMPANVELRTLDTHINDPAFGAAVVAAVRDLTRGKSIA
ncbi:MULTISPECIES: Tm-1-like ATP-binding domain-containing protein [unclassified Sphingomonas]|uniref:Tm-1-like ATP-binding domain-containing protein n=1 Tax=unclassified Sphingomonas TaxID=196159 RepID=UPI0006F35A90|nr:MULTISPECIES: Tm-1-like ATP-binding domain-containing protein [unclassified Sphingomonas]KRB78783.1 hypothetical protein ASE00_21375 [Sphingomonas sp. Root710]KRB93693.1 hypothetical protein ASE22_25145 [Sphingomonas sp. Root720]